MAGSKIGTAVVKGNGAENAIFPEDKVRKYCF